MGLDVDRYITLFTGIAVLLAAINYYLCNLYCRTLSQLEGLNERQGLKFQSLQKGLHSMWPAILKSGVTGT